jgi:hypothetical protein
LSDLFTNYDPRDPMRYTTRPVLAARGAYIEGFRKWPYGGHRQTGVGSTLLYQG